MIAKDSTYVVMGILNTDSIAYSTGRLIEALGGKVIWTAQNERMKKIFFDRGCKDLSDEVKASMDFRYCDVTEKEEVEALFAATGAIDGVLHSIAYANPKTCLGGEALYTDATEDVLQGFHISAASLATVANFAVPQMKKGGSIVTLSFEGQRPFPYYNWMGVNKAALEAVVRALARNYGKDRVRVNAVSAGPLTTKAASSIPYFEHLSKTWDQISPLPWDTVKDKEEVAGAVVFLLGQFAKKITGQTLFVDGGANFIGGTLMDFEKPSASEG
ncbi:MAG: enoyl-[acyl-carrier-protein] reductase FabI [Kiritimatiellaceae bacterium]|nr:enoyl-[acyl-carrier-protein] reductase FabI [Kiritimatiellaceae bacterium]